MSLDGSQRVKQRLRAHLKPITLFPIHAGHGASVLQMTCVVDAIPAFRSLSCGNDASACPQIHDSSSEAYALEPAPQRKDSSGEVYGDFNVPDRDLKPPLQPFYQTRHLGISSSLS